MRYLTSKRKRIAYLQPWPLEQASSGPDPRYRAYHQAMKEANLPEEIIVAPDKSGLQTRVSIRETVRNYVRENGAPEAIFCFNDERAIAALAALRDLNLRVPQDVLLIGCDGIEETLYHSPTISTIEYPIEETARLSWQLLQRRLEEPDAPVQSAHLTAKLALRKSSAA